MRNMTYLTEINNGRTSLLDQLGASRDMSALGQLATNEIELVTSHFCANNGHKQKSEKAFVSTC